MTSTPVPEDLILLDLGDRPWAAYASCRSADPEIFFSAADDSVAEAIRICRGCPVRQECLEWAILTHARYGVWGGMTERQRRRVARTIA